MPVAGGPPKQLTHINDCSMYANFSPDGQHIAYISASGLFVMNSDGSDSVPLFNITDLPGPLGADLLLNSRFGLAVLLTVAVRARG